jgi:lysophospholipase L1-like esterase
MAKKKSAAPVDPNPPVPVELPLRKRLLFGAILGLGLLIAFEGLGRIAYHQLFDAKKDLMLQAFFGLGGNYSPNMVSNFIPHHYLVYVLNPNAKANHQKYFGDQPGHYVNGAGYRGKDFAIKKTPGTYRIVCLGGSTTFGLYETDETKTYPAQLEAELSRRFASPTFEVINAGTPGWSSAEDLINLAFRVLELEPDLILTYEGVNDVFAMRNQEEGRSDYSLFRRQVYFRPPGPFVRSLIGPSLGLRVLYYYWYGPENIGFDINTLAVRKPPADYEQRLDTATGRFLERNLVNLVAVAKAHNVIPALVTMGHGPWHRAIDRTAEINRKVAAERGALLIDFEKQSQPQYFTGDRIHLTREGNLALARYIADQLSQAGLPFVPR